MEQVLVFMLTKHGPGYGQNLGMNAFVNKDEAQ
jgi:hypothetical protein